MNIYITKDLGCATFLYSRRFKLVKTEKVGRLISFTFSEVTPSKDYTLDDSVKDYYANDNGIMDFWLSLKTLKTLIHERIRNEG